MESTSQMMLSLEALDTLAVNCSLWPGSRLVAVAGARSITTCSGFLTEKLEEQPIMPTNEKTHRSPAERWIISGFSRSSERIREVTEEVVGCEERTIAVHVCQYIC